MFFSFPDSTSASEDSQKNLVDMPIERRKLEPLLQICQRFVVGNALDQIFQNSGVAATESSPLRGKPPVEDGAAVDFQAF